MRELSEAERTSLERRCIEEFGTTRDIRDAGWVLRDGTLLDFNRTSEWGDYEPGSEYERQRDLGGALDHVEIQQCFMHLADRALRFEAESDPTVFAMDALGALRVDLSGRFTGGFYSGSVNSRPTEAQARVVSRGCRGGCSWEVFSGDSSCAYKQHGRWSEFIEAIQRCRVG